MSMEHLKCPQINKDGQNIGQFNVDSDACGVSLPRARLMRSTFELKHLNGMDMVYSLVTVDINI